MTERLDGSVSGDRAMGIAASSYAEDERLLAELRASWPPPNPNGGDARGYVPADLTRTEPSAALRLGDRFAVAIVGQPDGSFLVVPLTRDEILVTSWRHAMPGDGLSAFVAGVPVASERPIEADQTNLSVVVGERVIVKWFRRIGPAPSRAAALIAHLDAVGFDEIPTPLGSLTWRSPAGLELTIAQGDAFLPGARDGWEWAVERLERHVEHGETDCPAACDPWIGARLGRLVGRLHAALRTPSRLLPEPMATASSADVARWRAAAAASLADTLRLTAGQDADAATLLRAIEPAMRADLERLPAGSAVEIQPVHGDLHVGQVLQWPGGLALIDFDGNPALDGDPAPGGDPALGGDPAPDADPGTGGDPRLAGDANALRQPAERDIAQMAMSLDHVGRIVDRRTAGSACPIVDAWIARTRREFLAGLDPDPDLLAAFEIEQECRELIYAARFLPRWRYAPLAALRARYGG